MTRDELEQTPWAKAFRESSPVSYKQAVVYALDPSLRVEIVRLSGRFDDMEWGVSAGDHDPDFLMEVCETRKRAQEVCREMGWKILRA